METRANYVAIGAFVLLVLMGAVGSLYWLYRSAEPGATALVRIVFPEPVTGLSNGSQVLFNGIRIGEVVELSFPADGGDNVIAVTRLNPAAPIKTDTDATLGFQGLTGVAYISMTGGSIQAPSLFEFVAGSGIPTINAEPSTFTSVLDSAEGVLERMNTTLEEVNTLINSNRDDVNAVVGNVRSLTEGLAAAAPQVSGLIEDVAQAGRTLSDTVPQINSVVENANAFLGAVEPARVAAIVESIEAFTGTLPTIASGAQEAVGTLNGLVTRLDDAAATLGEAMRAASSVLASVDDEAIAAIVDNVRVATGTVAERSGDVATILENAAATSGTVRAVGETLAGRRAEIDAALTDAAGIIANLNEASAEAPGLVTAATARVEEVGAVLQAIDTAAINAAVNDVAALARVLGGQAPVIETLLQSANGTALRAEAIASAIAVRMPQIGGAIDDATAAVASTNEFAATLPELAATLAPGVENAAAVLSAIDPEALSAIVGDARSLVATLSGQGDAVAAALTNVASAAEGIEALVTTLSDRAPQLASIVERADATAASVEEFAGRLPGLVETLEPGVANAAAVLSAVDPAAIEALVGDATRVSAVLAERAETLGTLIDAATGAARRIEAITSALALRTPQIGAVIDDLQALASSARGVANILPDLGASLQPGVANLSQALSAVDPAAVERLIGDALGFVEGLAAQRGTIETLVGEASRAAGDVATIASTLAERAPEVGAIVDQVGGAAGEIASLAGEAGSVIESIAPAAREAAGALGVITATRVDDVLTKAQLVATGLAQQAPAVDAILGDVRQTAEDARSLASAIAEQTPLIGDLLGNASSASQDVARAASELPGIVEDLAPGAERAGEALSSLDPEKISAVQNDAAALAQTLAAEREAIATLLQSSAGTARRAEAISSALALRMPQIGAIIDDAEASADDVRVFTASLPQFAATLEPGIANASAALSAIDAAAISAVLADAQRLSGALAAQDERIGSIVTGTDEVVASLGTLTDTLAQEAPQITSILARTDAAARDVAAFADALPDLVATLEPGIANASAALSSLDPEALAAILENVGTLTSALADSAPTLTTILARADTISADVAAISTSVRGELATLQAGLADARGALANVRTFTADLPTLLDEVRPGLANASAALSAIDAAAIDAIIDDVGKVSATIAGARGEIASVIATAGNAARQVDAVTGAIAERVDTIGTAIDDAARFSGAIGAAAPDVRAVLGGVEGAVGELTEALSAVDGEAVRTILANVQQASTALGSRAEAIGTAIDEALAAVRDITSGLGTAGGEDGAVSEVLDRARAIVANLERASAEVSGVVNRAGTLFDGPVQNLVADVSVAAGGIADVAASFATRADGIAGGLSKFSQSGLDDLRALLNQGRSTLAAIENTVASLDRNPSRVIFGGADGPQYQPQRR